MTIMLTMKDAQWHLGFMTSVLFPSWGQSIWKEEKEMQLREEEYSEQLTLADLYYQGDDMGKQEVHQPRSVVCSVFSVTCSCVCVLFNVSVFVDLYTWQNGIGHGPAALLGECLPICQLLLAQGLVLYFHQWGVSKSEMKTTSNIGFQHHLGREDQAAM